jgi:hypothetical protein
MLSVFQQYFFRKVLLSKTPLYLNKGKLLEVFGHLHNSLQFGNICHLFVSAVDLNVITDIIVDAFVCDSFKLSKWKHAYLAVFSLRDAWRMNARRFWLLIIAYWSKEYSMEQLFSILFICVFYDSGLARLWAID